MARDNAWTQEEEAWLRENYPNYVSRVLARMHAEAFPDGPARTESAIKAKGQKLRISKCDGFVRRETVFWTPERVEWFKEFVPGHEEREISAEHERIFGTPLSEAQIGNAKAKYGVKSGTKGGCFKKGFTPHNKGKTWDELGQYKAVILSNQIVMDDIRAQKLCAYVENGGTVIIDGKFGIIGNTARTLRQLPGGAANCLLGTSYLDADYEGLSFTYKDETIGGYCGRELMQVTDGEVLSRFADGFPAVVKKKYGKGTVLSFHTHLWYGYGKDEAPSHGKIAKALADEFSLRTFEIAGNVKVRVCGNEDGRVLFVFNYSDVEQAAKITFEGRTFDVSLAANDCVILPLDGSAENEQ